MKKYVMTVEAQQWTGHGSIPAVKRIPGAPIEDMGWIPESGHTVYHGDWVVRDGNVYSVYSPEHFKHRFTAASLPEVTHIGTHKETAVVVGFAERLTHNDIYEIGRILSEHRK